MAADSEAARPRMIVVDTNIIAYLLIDSRKTALARQLYTKDADWRFPALWRSEFHNVLVMQVRQRGFGLTTAERLWHTAIDLFSAAEAEVDMLLALGLAAQKQITGYDAQYVVLAQQLGVQCVSEDGELLRKCSNWVVNLVDAVSVA